MEESYTVAICFGPSAVTPGRVVVVKNVIRIQKTDDMVIITTTKEMHFVIARAIEQIDVSDWKLMRKLNQEADAEDERSSVDN
jgi:hypothetical protein